MGKRSSINKPLTAEDSRQSAPLFRTSEEESSIQKHANFWDKTNKGHISPLDTISGFMTLGYSVLFSIALGTVVGVFLSLSTQTGWFPDPLCRSNVRNLIRSKKQTLSNCGAFDDDGVFNPEKFEILFSKYAKSDKSGKTITMPELIRMTQEQERLGTSVKAWATSMVELCAAYFFIGHRGSITKEDVRSAYDGSLFYRLKDHHKLMIQDKKQELKLKGSYLSKPAGPLSVKALEHKMQVLFSALQSKSSIAAEYRYSVHDWVTYVQEKTDSIKGHALLPRVLRRPTSIIRGVTTPKSSMYRSSKGHDDPSQLFPNGLTGVAKATSDAAIMGPELSSSLLRSGAEDPSDSKTRGMHGIFGDDSGDNHLEQNQSIFFSTDLTTEMTKQNPTEFPPLPKSSVSATSSTVSLNNESLINGVLKIDDANSHQCFDTALTGVQQQQQQEQEQEQEKEHEQHQQDQPENNKKVHNISAKQSEKPQQDQQQHEASITPPPEEKTSMYTTTVNDNKVAVAPAPAPATTNNKKANKNHKIKLGQVSSNTDDLSLGLQPIK